MFLPFDPPSPHQTDGGQADQADQLTRCLEERPCDETPIQQADEIVGLSLPVVPSAPTITVPRRLGLMAAVADDRALGSFLRATLQASGMSINEMARRIGTNDKTIRQYLTGRRGKPSLKWFLRFIELTGARVWVEIPGQTPGQTQG